MKKVTKLFTLAVCLAASLNAQATVLNVTMNNRSTAMTMTDVNGTPINVGEPDGLNYKFEVSPGEYFITGIDANGNKNGSVNFLVNDGDSQSITIETQWIYVNNTDEDGNRWKIGDDYTIDVSYTPAYPSTNIDVKPTIGVSELDYAVGIITLNYEYDINVDFIPSQIRLDEGYRPITVIRESWRGGNSTITGTIPMSYLCEIKLPIDASVELASKGAHFKDFTPIFPDKTSEDAGVKTVTYRLLKGEYNLRAWKPGELTHACIFNQTDSDQTIEFTKNDFSIIDPKQVNHDPTSNSWLETGDIFLNINDCGYLNLKSGDIFDLHAMRTWELTNNSSANYFIEPDFHFTVYDLNGNPSSDVISIEGEGSTSAWRTLKAIGKGTAIVTVTYDAISVTQNGLTEEYMGGRYWGAIWPENTGVFIVTVDQDETSIATNMTVNAAYNVKEGGKSSKQAGAKVDAEHDVFYYLDTENGYNFTFSPEGVENVTIAYPTIGENSATYNGFKADGVTKNDDGSYTLLLKHGRQIVKLTDAAGKSVYQVLNAKPCHYEIINNSRIGSSKFHPDDNVSIQFSGLFHPSNKMAGIYNMSCHIAYSGVPSGTDLILGAGQYNFGGMPQAQKITLTIPSDYSFNDDNTICLSEGTLQVRGYGDPFGNHRSISRTVGRQPNMAAAIQEAYFGSVPTVSFEVTPSESFNITINCNEPDAKIILKKDGNEISPSEDGTYPGGYGSYIAIADKRGYSFGQEEFTIDKERGSEDYVCSIELEEVTGSWDGHSMDEPIQVEGVYQIGTAYELAWLANEVNSNNGKLNVALIADIDLNNMPWTPIGKSSKATYKGEFDGNNYTIKGLYINEPLELYRGLFGYVTTSSSKIENITVEGEVTGNLYVGGIAGYMSSTTVIGCVNRVNVVAKQYAAGIAGSYTGKVTIKNCYNLGSVTATNILGGIAGTVYSNSTMENVFNLGKLTLTGSTTAGVGPCSPASVKNGTNRFGLEDPDNNWTMGESTKDGSLIVSAEQMRSGEVAYLLGDAFGQLIGVDEHPVIGGVKVLYNEETKTYYNETYPVTVKMNAVSSIMTLTSTETGKTVVVGEPEKQVYTFNAPAGEYILTGYSKDGKTVNGTIVVNIEKSEELQEFTILTNTAYVSNKNEDGSVWTVENGDYTLDVTVNTREGERQTITVGNSTTAGRYTFLAFNGNSYTAAFIPSEAHQAEGYTTLYKAGTLTFNVNVYGKIPMAADYSITLPEAAELMVGVKFTHFTDFTPVEPKAIASEGGSKTVTYSLADGQVYNYRTWMKGGLTQAGYFTMNIDEAKRPVINFTDADYAAFDPHTVNHDPQSNKGYETGDIFVNINPQGHLKLNVGDTFDAHAMRTWQLTDNSTNNYFMEPDFHYTVVDLDGKPSTGVIEIDNADTTVSPWSSIKAVGSGTAIVLVTYDAIGVNYYSGDKKTAYLGGEYWGAIWPENTGVYVVTVGDSATGIVSEMTINEEYNIDAKRLAGKYVDAEHDVFYYLDTEEGASYTFTPEGIDNITIAYPIIGEQTVTYSGFGTEGVTKNDDGSYTLLLKHGRQIVKLTNEAGQSAYQVLTAKECHRDIVNVTREDSEDFQPGDKIEIRYSGLFHPANKLAGIYNMSAYVTYNGVPNGTSLILSANQYTFGSSAKAQTVTLEIPEDYDVDNEPELVLDNGVIQVNGYGDPIGNHRNISPLAGRSPNFTAIAHKTYFGMIPEVRIPISAKDDDHGSVDEIMADEADGVMYYNLQGIASDKPFKGLNIMRKADGTTTKVYIK